MALVETPTRAETVDASIGGTVCRCGHCRVMIDLRGGQRRARCHGCGRTNAVPRRVYTTCGRCEHEQHVRFSQRDGHRLCVNCGHPLQLREVELVVVRRRSHHHARSRPRSQQRESAILTMLLYAIALLVALIWFSQQ